MKTNFKSFQKLAGLVVGGTFFLATALASQAQITTNAYESFSYTGGTLLTGQNGGFGWTSAWVNDLPTGSSLLISSIGMTYAGLTTVGGSAALSTSDSGISEDSRSLKLENSGIVYVQFISRFNGASGGGAPSIQLLNNGILTGGFGANGGSTMSILNSTLQTTGTSSSTAPLGNVNLVIARIDYQNNNTELWVNPNVGAFDYAAPATNPDATYANLAPVFNGVAIDTRTSADVDELSIMVVPEPTPAVILGVGFGLSLLIGRWREQK